MPTTTLILAQGDPKRVRKKIWEAMSRLWGDAAIHAVKVAATNVASSTGMSAASLLPMIEKASLVSKTLGAKAQADVLSDIKARQKFDRRAGLVPPDMPYIKGTTDMSHYKVIKEGIAAGKEFSNFSVGRPTNPVFSFEFSINVFQYKFWESAWGSLDAGNAAFMTFLHANFNKYMPTFQELFPSRKIG